MFLGEDVDVSPGFGPLETMLVNFQPPNIALLNQVSIEFAALRQSYVSPNKHLIKKYCDWLPFLFKTSIKSSRQSSEV